jgi:hypothetical protein
MTDIKLSQYRLKIQFENIRDKIPKDIYDKLFLHINNISKLLILVENFIENLKSQEYVEIMNTIKRLYNLQSNVNIFTNNYSEQEEIINSVIQNPVPERVTPECNCIIGSNCWCIYSITALYNCRNRNILLEYLPNIGLCFELVIPNYPINNYEFTTVPNIINELSNACVDSIIMFLLKLINNCSNENYEKRFYNRIMIHFILFCFLFKYFTYVSNNTERLKLAFYNKFSDIYTETLDYKTDYILVIQRLNVADNILDVMKQNMALYLSL